MDFIIYLLFSFSPILVILPGITLSYFFYKLLYPKLTKLEYLVAGHILWTFLVLSPMYVCITFNANVIFILSIFKIISLLFSIVSIYILFTLLYKRMRSKRIKIHLPLGSIVIGMPLCILIISVSMIQLFNPIIYNWDAVSIYIPLARELSSYGYFNGASHGTTYAATVLPFLPCYYALLISLTGGIYVRLLPTFMLLLNSIVISSIIKRLELKINNASLLGIIIFVMSPSIVVLAGFEGLYSDLFFIYFTLAAILFVALYARTRSLFYLIIASASICLSISSKEYGLFFSPFLIGLILFLSQANRGLKYFFTVFFFFCPFYILTIWDFSARAKPLQETIFRIIFLFLFGVLSIILLKKVERTINSARTLNLVSFARSIKHMFLFIIMLLPISSFIFRNIMNFGTITSSWSPKVSQLLVSINYPLPVQETKNLLTYVNSFSALYAGINLGFITFPLFLLSMNYFKKRNEWELLFPVLTFWLINIILLYLFFFHNFQFTEYRRLSILVPCMSIFAIVGLAFLIEAFESASYIYSLYYSAVFMLFSNIYFLLYDSNLFKLKNLPDGPFWLYPVALIALFLPYIVKKLSKKGAFTARKCSFARYIYFMFTLFLILDTLAFAFFTNQLHSGLPSDADNFQTWYYDDFRSLWYPFLQISEYLLKNTPVDCKIVSFGALPLIYYTNRTFIDLDYFGIIALIDYIQYNDSDSLILRLYNDKILYLMVPTENHWGAEFQLYTQLAKKYLLFNLTNGNYDGVYPVLILNEYTLFKIIPVKRIPLLTINNNFTLSSDWSQGGVWLSKDSVIGINASSNVDGYVDLKISFLRPISLANVYALTCNLLTSVCSQTNYTVDFFVYDNQGKWGSVPVINTFNIWNDSVKIVKSSIFVQTGFDWDAISSIKFSIKTSPLSKASVIIDINSIKLTVPTS